MSETSLEPEAWTPATYKKAWDAALAAEQANAEKAEKSEAAAKAPSRGKKA